MRIGFELPCLKLLCNSQERLHQAFGAELAIIAQRLLWSLDAASSVADLSSLPPLFCRRIDDGDPPTYSVGSKGKIQILFHPDQGESNYLALKINKIRIIKIGGAD